MKKQILLTILGLFSLQLEATAPCKPVVKQEAEPPKTTIETFHNNHRNFYIKADYLFWKPFQEDLYYGLRSDFSDPLNVKARRKQVDLDWNSGARLGIGAYAHDRWDISLTGTYFYSEGDQKTKAYDLSSSGINNYFAPNITGYASIKTTAGLQLNYWTADLLLGRDVFISEHFVLHPFVGVRGVGVYENFRVNYLSSVATGPLVTLASTRFKAVNNYWGVGPRAGLDCSFFFTHNWLVLGGVSGSIVLGQFDVKNKYYGYLFLDPVAHTLNELGNVVIRDDHNAIRVNVEAFIGVAWKSWVYKNKNRLEIALMAEGVNWFNMNQISTNTSLPVSSVANFADSFETDGGNKRHGDLSFLGLTLRFQLDY